MKGYREPNLDWRHKSNGKTIKLTGKETVASAKLILVVSVQHFLRQPIIWFLNKIYTIYTRKLRRLAHPASTLTQLTKAESVANKHPSHSWSVHLAI